MRKIRLCWPEDYQLAFTIRDDDVSYFTTPQQIDQIYKEAWQTGFKITLAAIPKHKATEDRSIPHQFRGDLGSHDLRDNMDLIKHLEKALQSGLIDVIQHGFTHEEISGKPEFYINDISELRMRLEEGNRILENSFKKKINVFSAPHGMISREAWKILREEGITICRTYGLYTLLKNTPITISNLKTLIKIGLQHPHILKRPIPTGIVKFPGMIEMQSSWVHASDLPYDLKVFKAKFAEALQHRGLFNLITHHWDYFDESRKELVGNSLLNSLYEILDYVDQYPVWKTTLPAVSEWIKSRLET